MGTNLDEPVAAGTKIPFNVPSLAGRELDYVREAVESGRGSSSGPFSKRAATLLREQLGAAEVLMTTSCTDALEMSALLLDLGPGDTVIVPSFTFVSTALAFARQGVRLLFADIEPETLGMDPAHVAALLDDDVRAVVPVHYAGVACDLDGIAAAVQGRDVTIIEDNAQGLFARYKEKPLGSIGRFSALSFHETKNFVCGEGGAFVINDPDDVARAHILYDKGTNRQAFMLGLVDKYSWVDVGSSFGMSDVLAAYLLAQLEQRDAITASRRRIFERYDTLLAPGAATGAYATPRVSADREHPYHMYYVLLPDRSERDRVLKGLHEREIQATFHYVPLHDAAGARAHTARPTECPVTDDIAGRLIRLPFFNTLADDQVDRVAAAFLDLVGLG